MSSVGAAELSQKFGSPLRIAEALIRGEIPGHLQKYVDEHVSLVVMEAAKFRIQHGLDKQYVISPKSPNSM